MLSLTPSPTPYVSLPLTGNQAGKCHLGSKVDTKGCLACLKNKFGSELRFFA